MALFRGSVHRVPKINDSTTRHISPLIRDRGGNVEAVPNMACRVIYENIPRVLLEIEVAESEFVNRPKKRRKTKQFFSSR